MKMCIKFDLYPMKMKIMMSLLLGMPSLLLAQSFHVHNKSNKAQNDVLISVPWAGLQKAAEGLETFKVIEPTSKKEYPYQLEYLGEKVAKNLLVQVSVPAKTSLTLQLVAGTPTAIEPKTFARYVPERLDDFAWENDKIAFRTYGKALEGTKGDAYGLDVWVKRTNKLIIDTRYKHGDYHHDLGDGLDYYHVGHTLGAGNIAPVIGDKIIYPKNYHRYKILDNGPLRTTFVLEYDPWMVGNREVSVSKKISIDAGSQMNKIEVNFEYQGNDSLPVVIGIIKRPEPGSITIDEQAGITSYWEPSHGADGTTGVAVILKTPVTKSAITADQILTYSIYRKGQPFVYYMGAAWDQAGEIMKAEKWLNYVRKFDKKTPLKINLL